MNFKNALEQQCFEIAKRVLGPAVNIEHNKRLQIENALFPEVAAFKGPPAKEVDVLVAKLLDAPRVYLLVSCKELSRPAEPAHVQEWAAVVRTMNQYSDGAVYFGIVISPTGFTSGCEGWATSHNIGLIPPLKGRRLVFSPPTVFRMFGRALGALRTRVRINTDNLIIAPAFFDFVFSLISDFEGHEEVSRDARYFIFPQGWVSSFAEMYRTLAGHVVENLTATVNDAVAIHVSDGISCRFTGAHVEFGPGLQHRSGTLRTPACVKNFEAEPCTLEFVKQTVIGTHVTSAADFGNFIEFGLDHRFNLGLRLGGFQVISTENPIDEHRL